MAGLPAHTVARTYAGAFNLAFRMLGRACEYAGGGGV